MVLHRPGENPLVEENGLDVLPATRTSFAMEIKDLRRQPEPFPSKCISARNESWFDEARFPFVKGRMYSQVGVNSAITTRVGYE